MDVENFHETHRVPRKMFSQAEKDEHRRQVNVITRTAAEWLNSTFLDHISFFDQHRVSKYYGNRRRDYQTREGRIRELRRLGKDIRLADQQIATACILLAMQALKAGFESAHMDSTWAKIHRVLAIDNAFLGTDLQQMLQQLGWKIYYWNPDPSKSREWDAEDQRLNPAPEGRWNPAWGGHYLRCRSVMTRNDYSGKRVDNRDLLVDFQSQPPEEFSRVPFFVGTAHDGYHVFPGYLGKVIEAHSTRDMDDRDNIEESEFNPLARGGGPRWTPKLKYRSGLIVAP